ncbi:hypothetical protein ILUMI_11114 [Ignelater luminosus]|uniref:DUF5641 domain-containing protein n=1 Tax=Ignelater luminosus TaxID=2038154 RepID=A0A8K0D0U6_IGNLU|nr:hypothetical protein ILUMI_11114 [Ignelater luminosus]
MSSRQIIINPNINAAKGFLETLNNFENSIKDFPENATEEELEIFSLNLRDIESLLNDYQASYFQLSEQEIQCSNLLTRNKFQSKQNRCIVRAKNLIKMHKEQSNLVNKHHTQIGGESNKCERILQTTLQQSLPRLSLPTFHDNFIDYLPFIDNFKSIVDRASISNSQKFFHLLSCVKEGAKEVIAGLLPSDKNYDIALALLEARYNKPKLIIQAHIKNSFELKPVTKSASSLCKFTDNLNKNVSCLHNMKLTDSQIAGALCSYVVSNKLDSETKEKFKMSNPNEIPSIDNTVTFLQNRVQLLLEKNLQSKFNGAKLDNVRPKDQIHFRENVRKNKDGRFIVKTPFNEKIQNMGGSYSSALNRFLNLERRLSKDKIVRNQYVNFMKEYENLKHMTKVNINPIELNKYYFLPHHPVLRADSITTKLRVVFDGSATTTTGLSINDCQKNGPVVQNDLFSILIQFGEHSVAIIADSERLYRQILVSPEDRRYQTILWRDNLNEMVSAYSLNTVTYGCKSSSYLATRCLKQLAEECKESNKSVSELINKSLYVDDLIYSGVDAVSVKNLMRETMKVFGSAGIQLRKFISNVPAALPKPAQINVEYFTINLKETETTKALGLQWVLQPDVLKYSFEFNAAQDTVTKRFILSTIARVFDSIGLISPILVKGKILMQKLWQDKLGWDGPIIDGSLKQYWESLLQDLRRIHELEIPRCERQIEQLKVGDLVLLKTENTSPLTWPLARVTEVYPSPNDNLVRVASVKCANGAVFKRSIAKMCALPIY